MRHPNHYPKPFRAAAACLIGGGALAACGSATPASGEALPTGAYVTYQAGHTNLALCFQRATDGAIVTIDMNAGESFYAGRLHLTVYPELVQESSPGGDISTPFGSRQPIGSVALVRQIRRGGLHPYPHENYSNRSITMPCQATSPTPLPSDFTDNLAVVNRTLGESRPGALLVPMDGAWQADDPPYSSPVGVFLPPPLPGE